MPETWTFPTFHLRVFFASAQYSPGSGRWIGADLFGWEKGPAFGEGFKWGLPVLGISGFILGVVENEWCWF